MLLRYGPVSLNLLHMTQYSQEAVYDGINFLWYKVRIGVRAVFNPATQTDSTDLLASLGVPSGSDTTFGPPGLPQPDDRPKEVAAESIRAVRDSLMRPRQRLIFSIGPHTVLVSPMIGQATDANAGPIPIACNIVEAHGYRTFIVDYTIETYINAFAGDYSQNSTDGVPEGNLILSHWFESTHAFDQDYFITMVHHGRVTFNMGVLTQFANGILADTYRAFVVPPLPLGFRRHEIKVWSGGAPNVLEYQVTDHEQPLAWPNIPPFNKVTRVGATHQVAVGRHSPSLSISPLVSRGIEVVHARLANATAQARRTLASAYNQATAEAAATNLRAAEIAGSEAAIAAGHVSLGIAAAEAVSEQTIRTSHILTVDCWGCPNSTKVELEQAARLIIGTRLIMIESVMRAYAAGNGANALAVAAGASNRFVQTFYRAQALSGLDPSLSWLDEVVIDYDLFGKHLRMVARATSGFTSSISGVVTYPGIFNATFDFSALPFQEEMLLQLSSGSVIPIVIDNRHPGVIQKDFVRFGPVAVAPIAPGARTATPEWVLGCMLAQGYVAQYDQSDPLAAQQHYKYLSIIQGVQPTPLNTPQISKNYPDIQGLPEF